MHEPLKPELVEWPLNGKPQLDLHHIDIRNGPVRDYLERFGLLKNQLSPKLKAGRANLE